MTKRILPGDLAYARLPCGDDVVSLVLVIGEAGSRRWLCRVSGPVATEGLLTVSEDDLTDVFDQARR